MRAVLLVFLLCITVSAQCEFDGTDSVVTIGKNLHDWNFVQTCGVFTICGWVQNDAAAADTSKQIMGVAPSAYANPGWSLSWLNRSVYSEDAQLLLAIHRMDGEMGAYIYRTNSLTDTNWHHFAVTGEGLCSNVLMYYDGELAGSTTVSVLRTATVNDMWIGKGNNTWPSYWDGAMQDMRIYTRALTPMEVTELYLHPWMEYTNCIGRWCLREQVDNRRVADLSTNNNTGVVSNSVAFVAYGATLSSHKAVFDADADTIYVSSIPAYDLNSAGTLIVRDFVRYNTTGYGAIFSRGSWVSHGHKRLGFALFNWDCVYACLGNGTSQMLNMGAHGINTTNFMAYSWDGTTIVGCLNTTITCMPQNVAASMDGWDIQIGSSEYAQYDLFRGSVGDVYLLGYAMSSNQLLAVQAGAEPTNPVGHWVMQPKTMNTGDTFSNGSVAHDYSGHENHGTYSNDIIVAPGCIQYRKPSCAF